MSTATLRRRGRDQRLVLVLLLAAAAALAVQVVRPVHAHDLSLSPWVSAAFLAMWLLMVVAMMLPTAVPLLTTAGRLGGASGSRTTPRTTLAATAAGYLAAWLAAGVVVRVADVAGGRLLARWWGLQPSSTMPMPHEAVMLTLPRTASHLLAAGVLVAAAGYQVSPLANRCLRACRSPFGFFARSWDPSRPVRATSAAGLRYGLSCIGCCAALMVLLLVVGMQDLWWMLALGAVMAVQKNHPRGVLVARASAIALLVAAAFFAATAHLGVPMAGHGMPRTGGTAGMPTAGEGPGLAVCLAAGALTFGTVVLGPRRVLGRATASLAVVAGVAHVPVTPSHLEEAPYIGVLFVLLTTVMVVGATLLLATDGSAAYAVLGLSAVAAVAAYAVSRTVGLPLMSDDIGNWAEPLGLVSIVSESLLAVVCAVVLWRRRKSPRHMSRTPAAVRRTPENHHPATSRSE